jgi:hypothetical protein
MGAIPAYSCQIEACYIVALYLRKAMAEQSSAPYLLLNFSALLLNFSACHAGAASVALLNLSSTGLYRQEYEKDSCEFGLIAQMDDQPRHWLVETAIKSLARLTHRGAMAADGNTGDGCGLLIKKADSFLRNIAVEAGIALNSLFTSGMVFLNQDAHLAHIARRRLEVAINNEGLERADWRPVPTDPAACGSEALKRHNWPDAKQNRTPPCA